MRQDGNSPDGVKIAWISAGAVVTAALIALFPHIYNKEVMPAKVTPSSSNFSGIVRSTDGNPISGTHIEITLNQQGPQLMISDSEGAFNIAVPPDTITMHLFAQRDDYASVDLDVNPHRSGPQEIQLTRLSPANPPSKPHQKSSKQSGSISSAGTLSAKPLREELVQKPTSNSLVIPACAPGVLNCNLAPNNGDQSIHINEPKPLPKVTFSQSSLPAIEQSSLRTKHDALLDLVEGGLRDHPGVLLTLRVERMFDDPVFDIDCDNPCELTTTELGTITPSSSNTTGARLAAHGKTPDSRHHRLAFVDRLAPGYAFVVRIRSANSVPVAVTSVRASSLD